MARNEQQPQQTRRTSTASRTTQRRTVQRRAGESGVRTRTVRTTNASRRASTDKPIRTTTVRKPQPAAKAARRPSVHEPRPSSAKVASQKARKAIGGTAATLSQKISVKKLAGIAAAALLVLAVGVLGYRISHPGTMDVLVNGMKIEVAKAATIDDAVAQAGPIAKPGRLIAVDGTVLDEEGGEAPVVHLNGIVTKDNVALQEGDTVLVESGKDVTESTKKMDLPKKLYVEDDGTMGAIHEIVDYDPDATYRTEVGSVSEIPVEEAADGEWQAARLTKYSVYTEDKVVALTFDDGPWENTTAEILDILKENDAKATFFVIGTRFDGDQPMSDMLKREVREGHQVCTHSYSHAAGDGGGKNLGFMTPEDQVREIVDGQKAIETATGQPASTIIRAPGGNYSADVAYNVREHVTYEIGWDIDTNDWKKPGADAIEAQLLSVQGGNIVLMHDGGGDRTQTIEALRRALPALKEEGWEFVTVEELMNRYL